MQAQRAKNAANTNLSTNGNSGSVLVPFSEVAKRDYEIQALTLEVGCLKTQLEEVKLRNKKLCEVSVLVKREQVITVYQKVYFFMLFKFL